MKKALIIIGAALAALTGVAYGIGKIRQSEEKKLTDKVEKKDEEQEAGASA